MDCPKCGTEVGESHSEYVMRNRKERRKFVRGGLTPEAKIAVKEEALERITAPKEERLAKLREMLAQPTGVGVAVKEVVLAQVCGNGKWRCGTKPTREFRGVPFCEGHYWKQEGAE